MEVVEMVTALDIRGFLDIRPPLLAWFRPVVNTGNGFNRLNDGRYEKSLPGQPVGGFVCSDGM